MNELSRIKKIIGESNLNKLKNVSVFIVGIGGVGGACLEVIARSGIENIIIADYDSFDDTNLNRQILSLKSNIGKKKVLVAKKRVHEINPDINVTALDVKVDENVKNIIPNVNYIIDACDDVKAKVTLIKYAIKYDIKIITCCGTGNRLNPEKLMITNIWKTEYDPLAKKLRQELRKEKINYKLPVVCSTEKPIIKGNGPVGSLAMVPNAAGILLASYVINDVIK